MLERGSTSGAGAGTAASYTSDPESSRSLAANGVCEDGGQGAQSALCLLGSDCTDCGKRSLEARTRTVECRHTQTTNLLNEKNEYALEVSAPSGTPSFDVQVEWAGTALDPAGEGPAYAAFAGGACPSGTGAQYWGRL